MSPNRRIVLNVAATYARSLYAMVLGLFTARWALQALGRTDYGLMGLVGGLSGFVTFFNGLMASAVGRFYAVSVGKASRNKEAEVGIEECRMWFNTALTIHTVLPFALVLVGYPIGAWAVRHFLTIPVDRIDDCILVWRFTCFSCLIAMVNVPFQAMYTAKQEIAELTVYGIVTATLNAAFLYWMISRPGDWLVKFAAWTCLLSVMPQIIIGCRALFKYRECRISACYMWKFDRIKEICKYAYARFVANLSETFSTQAKAIVVNKFMGPDYNASMTVGTSLSSHAMTFSSSLSAAMWPAIANKAGEGDDEGVRRLCFIACRVGALLVLVFAIPLSIEINEVLRLWLGAPPPFTAEVCCAILLSTAIQKMSDGYWMAILGKGKGVVYYSHRSCIPGFLLVAIACLLFMLGCGMWSVVVAIASFGVMLTSVRIVAGHRLLSYSPRYWLNAVFVPISLATTISFLAGLSTRFFMNPSLLRIVATTALSDVLFLSLVWIVVLKGTERDFMKRKFQLLLNRIGCVG